MAARIEKIGKSLIQHGKGNDRVYVMKLYAEDLSGVLERTHSLCREEGYSKVFAKVPESLAGGFLDRGFEKEAEISRLYCGRERGLFLGKFLNRERKDSREKRRIDQVKAIAGAKVTARTAPALPAGCRLRKLDAGDAEYLKMTMGDNTEYAGVFLGNELVSIASAEKSPEYLNAEMTDFATSRGNRGNSFSLIILRFLEERLAACGYKTLYTIARALSAPMNVTFKKAGYKYSGTLVNNTDIAGAIESMNVWYRECR